MADDLKLEEINFGAPEFPQDPKPTTAKKPASKSTGRTVGRPSRDTKVKEVSAEIESLLKMANLALMARDLHEVYDDGEMVGYETCLGIYVEQDSRGKPKLTAEGANFCDAFADIAVDSSFIMKLLDSGDTAGKWIRLAMAIQPLAMNVIYNHGRRNQDVRTEVSSS